MYHTLGKLYDAQQIYLQKGSQNLVKSTLPEGVEIEVSL